MRIFRERFDEDFVNDENEKVNNDTLARFIKRHLDEKDMIYIVNCCIFVTGKGHIIEEIMNDVKFSKEFIVDYDNKTMILNTNI